MKQVKFVALIAIAAFFFSSCNSGDKKTDQTTTDSTATKMANDSTAKPTTPAPQMLMSLQFKVSNFDKWKASYESHDSVRMANGLHKFVIARGTDDPNTVLVAMMMDDVNKAKAMASSKEMQDRMKAGGVVGTPIINYIEAISYDTSALQQTTRLMVRHKVKDYDAWKKVYDSDAQARMDAGLTQRMLAHAVGDNNDVTIVFAVSDEAKAKAMGSSKALKDKMDAGGVVGPPTMFYYKIVQKY